MSAYFECTPIAGNRFRFTLKSAGHDILMTSKGYATEAACLAAIASARHHACDGINFVARRSRDRSNYFVLVAVHQQVIATSARHASATAMAESLAFVKAWAPQAAVEAPLGPDLWHVAMAMARPLNAGSPAP